MVAGDRASNPKTLGFRILEKGVSFLVTRSSSLKSCHCHVDFKLKKVERGQGDRLETTPRTRAIPFFFPILPMVLRPWTSVSIDCASQTREGKFAAAPQNESGFIIESACCR